MDVREKLVEICFHEFCMVAGDSPCGCDGCPYGKYGSDVCYEEYKKYKLENLEKTSVTVQELDGCGFCQKFDFAGARAEVNKYGAHISLAICNTKFPDEERFKFCPMCGRRLPQPPKGE